VRLTGGKAVIKKTTSLYQAQRSLGYGNSRRQQAVIPMDGKVWKGVRAGNPTKLPKKWRGGSMWWYNWNPIHQMRRMCAKEAPINYINIARRNGAKARMSSQYGSYSNWGAYRAIDGKPYGRFFHTRSDRPAWWELDLKKMQRIDFIKIWNRQDCCGNRFRNYNL
jgi:hypothetical protein